MRRRGQFYLRYSPVTLVRVTGNVVSSVLVDAARVEEMLMQMVDKLENIALHRA
jgi:hypothetical protein